jgi:hypothetical protein
VRKVTLQDAVDIFLDSPDIIPIFSVVKKGDYAVQVREDEHLYLVVEVRGQGILIGRLPPDLVQLRRIEDENEHYRAQDFIRRRLREAGLV